MAITSCKSNTVIFLIFQNAHLSLAPPETGYHGFASGTNGEGFFRFTVNDTTFRLMLLSKDKQNLLKIISYDFLMVGMQVRQTLLVEMKVSEAKAIVQAFCKDIFGRKLSNVSSQIDGITCPR